MPKPVSPIVPGLKLPEVVYAKDQPQYEPLPVFKQDDGIVLSRWKLTWREAGPDFENVFDVRAAAHQAWTVKAAKASELFDVSGQSVSQIAERCREMAESFEPVLIA
jgi:hypothetical protein